MSETFSTFKKTNPLMLLLMAALSILAGRILYSSIPLDRKTTLFILSFALILVAVIFEARQIDGKEQLKEEALRHRLFGG